MDTSIRAHMTPAPHTIGKDQSLETATQIMREHHVRHLPVLDGGKVIGVVSQRDILFLEALADVDATAVTVEEAMSPEPFSVPADAPIADVVRTMSEHRFGAALVVHHGHVIGIFTTTDALDVLAKVLPARAPAAERVHVG